MLGERGRVGRGRSEKRKAGREETKRRGERWSDRWRLERERERMMEVAIISTKTELPLCVCVICSRSLSRSGLVITNCLELVVLSLRNAETPHPATHPHIARTSPEAFFKISSWAGMRTHDIQNEMLEP